MSKKTEVLQSLAALGISADDAQKLRRISLTLNRWWCLNCGTDAGRIGRDENGKPFFVREYVDRSTGKCKTTRLKIADRERGALDRLKKIMTGYASLCAYLQTDPRGHSVYILRNIDIPTGGEVSQYYTNGVAVF